MLIIGGLSYLMSVVVGFIRVDLMGNSEVARYYYCQFEPEIAGGNVYATLPLLGVVVLTGTTLVQKMLHSFKSGSDMFLFELCLGVAMLLVGVPLYFKCNQLVNTGCVTPPLLPSPWPVHQNLLMFHVCVVLILAGTAFGEMWILMHELRRLLKPSKKFS